MHKGDHKQPQVTVCDRYCWSNWLSRKNNSSGVGFVLFYVFATKECRAAAAMPFVKHPCTKQTQKLGEHVNLTLHAVLHRQNGNKKAGLYVCSHDKKKRISIAKKIATLNFAVCEHSHRPHFRDKSGQAVSICNNLLSWMRIIIDYKWGKNCYIYHKTALCLIIKSAQQA